MKAIFTDMNIFDDRITHHYILKLIDKHKDALVILQKSGNYQCDFNNKYINVIFLNGLRFTENIAINIQEWLNHHLEVDNILILSDKELELSHLKKYQIKIGYKFNFLKYIKAKCIFKKKFINNYTKIPEFHSRKYF